MSGRLPRPFVECLETRSYFSAQAPGVVDLLANGVGLGIDGFNVDTGGSQAMTQLINKLVDTEAVLNAKGTLLIRGTDTADAIQLVRSGGNMQVLITRAAPDPDEQGRLTAVFVESPGGESRQSLLLEADKGKETFSYSVPLSHIKRVLVDGGNGNDVLTIDPALPTPSENSIEGTLTGQKPAPPKQTPSDPAPGVYNNSAAAWKQKLSQQIDAADQSRAQLAFFGDSHAERYPYYGRNSWNANFPNALDLGTSGDGTRQLLDRINAGLFDTYKPKIVVLMIGTNNFNDPAVDGTDDQIEAGIQKVVTSLHAKLPVTKIVVVSILPRTGEGLNDRIEDLNSMTGEWAATQNDVSFLDVYGHFVGDPIRRALMNPDNHLNAAGYRMLTTYLVQLLRSI